MVASNIVLCRPVHSTLTISSTPYLRYSTHPWSSSAPLSSLRSLSLSLLSLLLLLLSSGSLAKPAHRGPLRGLKMRTRMRSSSINSLESSMARDIVSVSRTNKSRRRPAKDDAALAASRFTSVSVSVSLALSVGFVSGPWISIDKRHGLRLKSNRPPKLKVLWTVGTNFPPTTDILAGGQSTIQVRFNRMAMGDGGSGGGGGDARVGESGWLLLGATELPVELGAMLEPAMVSCRYR